ncbi:MAG TPA: toll/interleukin-1 receptor domain-containing protein [Chryseobacterium sp.]
MATRKKNPNGTSVASDEEKLSNNHPLVFISHDTRDAELAEEFSNLLKSASAGALKSFRSSDKKGTQGIEYGLEWYPAIMEKIDQATDVVCLLTQNSIDRPWILYEAGVAKGKLDKKVIGVALGIPFNTAISGPFALFQNNAGDPESVTKLVIELVTKVPGLDPDRSLFEFLVDKFIKKVTEITEKIKATTSVEKESYNDEISTAKLFEEVKIMFDSLPSRIENRLDPEFRRRKRKIHPSMLNEIMHFGFEVSDPAVGFMIFISFYRDDFPWFYEIGMETYRGLKSAKTVNDRDRIVRTFERAMEMLTHPIMRESYGESKEIYILLKESRHLAHRLIEELIIDNERKVKSKD